MTIGFVALATFILAGIHQTLYSGIQKKKTEALKIIGEKTEKLLDDSKECIKKNKRDFVHDLRGLYSAEILIKQAEKTYRNIFVSLSFLCLFIFIIEVLGVALNNENIPLFVLIFEVPVVFAFRFLGSLWLISSCVDTIVDGKEPREIVRKRSMRMFG